MGETVTFEIPVELARKARALAAATNRRFEEALVEWIRRAVADPPVESLDDKELLALCEDKLDAFRQEELTRLLVRNREGLLEEADRAKLDELMLEYRRRWVVKARALKEAVARGLKPALGQDAA
jgi:hypothetical protein